ncbi:MAG: tRNA-dihydrouridine synthase family protein [Candidatus Woesearchaeota archaeon]
MIYILAPMEDITSNSFRSLCHKYGADLTFTELIHITGLAKEDKNTLSRIELKDDTPTVIQLLGSKEPDFKKFLSMFKPSRGFRGFNLNLGCPNPQAVKLGYGCAMIKRINKTKNIVQIFREYNYPISVKLRLGLNRYEKQNKVYLKLIDAVDADFFIVHARHGNQGYDEPADFSVYRECVKTGKQIIANGDICTKKQVESLEKIGIKGVMIGRAAVKNPAIFSMLKGLEPPSLDMLKKEHLELGSRFNEPFRYRKNVMKHMGKE